MFAKDILSEQQSSFRSRRGITKIIYGRGYCKNAKSIKHQSTDYMLTSEKLLTVYCEE